MRVYVNIVRHVVCFVCVEHYFPLEILTCPASQPASKKKTVREPHVLHPPPEKRPRRTSISLSIYIHTCMVHARIIHDGHHCRTYYYDRSKNQQNEHENLPLSSSQHDNGRFKKTSASRLSSPFFFTKTGRPSGTSPPPAAEPFFPPTL